MDAPDPSPCTFRPATRADLPEIVRLLVDDPLGRTREVSSGADVDEGYVRGFEAIAADPGNEVVVAEHDGAIVGCMQLTVIPQLTYGGRPRLQVEGVRVAASLRSRGIGAKMMEHAVERARSAGCTLVQLTSDRTRGRALAFYERLGYSPSHVGFKLKLE